MGERAIWGRCRFYRKSRADVNNNHGAYYFLFYHFKKELNVVLLILYGLNPCSGRFY